MSPQPPILPGPADDPSWSQSSRTRTSSSNHINPFSHSNHPGYSYKNYSQHHFTSYSPNQPLVSEDTLTPDLLSFPDSPLVFVPNEEWQTDSAFVEPWADLNTTFALEDPASVLSPFDESFTSMPDLSGSFTQHSQSGGASHSVSPPEQPSLHYQMSGLLYHKNILKYISTNVRTDNGTSSDSNSRVNNFSTPSPPTSNKTSSKTPIRYSHNSEDKVTKRTMNTLAARRYRQKRVDQMSDLETALKETQSEREELKVRVARLEGELDALKSLLKG